MPHKRCQLWPLACIAVGSAALIVSACGDGTFRWTMPTSPPDAFEVVPDEVGVDTPSVSGALRHKVAEAAQNLPRPGSVTQSSHANEYGVTVDIISVEVTELSEEPNYVVTYNDLEIASTDDGSAITDVGDTLDQPKGTHLYERVDGGVEFYRSVEDSPTEFGKHGPLPGSWGLSAGDIWIDVSTELLDTEPRASQTLVAGDRVRGLITTGADNDGYLNDVAGTFICTLSCTFQMDSAATSDGDESVLASSSGYAFVPLQRYLAHGTWTYVPDDARSFDDYEYGAFIDGDDPFEQSNLAGLTGTATYVGEDGAQGIYANAAKQANQPFNADVTLMASFGYGDDLGWIWGNINDIIIDGIALSGNPQISLRNTPIGSTHSGFFSGDTRMSFGVTTLTGKWGGQFYGNEISDADTPAAVAGTFGVANVAGGESFLGVFGAQETLKESENQATDLAEYLTSSIDQGKAPGMIAAIIDEGGVRAIGAAGVRRQGSPDAFTVDDLVHVGSNTKAMTSTMLATLVEDGTFANGWSTTIAEVFPELVDEIHQDYHSIELSQLIRMQGGIRRNAEDWWAYLSNPNVVKRRYGILRDNLGDAPAGTEGEHLYSNLSYMVAGAMAEKLTGKSWEALMEERLFTPLGITTAGFGPPGIPGGIDQPWGHHPDESGVWIPNQYDNSSTLGPAGTVHISVEDWAKFISLWFSNKEPEILNLDTLNELITPISGTYAAGWFVLTRSWADGATLNHNGSNTYWNSHLWIAPSRGLAYLAVANSSDLYQNFGVSNALDSIVYSLVLDTDELSREVGGSVGGSIGNVPAEELSERLWLLDAAVVRSVISVQAPGFSSEDVGPSVSRLRQAANALLASDLLVFVGDSAPGRGQTMCHGAACSSGIADATLTLSASDVNFGGLGIAYEPVASHRGVSLAQGQGENSIAGTSVEYDAYGGWLRHSFFATETGGIAEGLFDGTPVAYSYSVGDAPNSNPIAADGSGTWRGVMVGADVSQTATRGHPIQGDAEITIADFDDPQADVAFTRIFDLHAQTQRDDIAWAGIAVTDGGFASGTDEDSIEGRFYGPNHEEVGGIFERNGVLGAFGAARSVSVQ